MVCKDRFSGMPVRSLICCTCADVQLGGFTITAHADSPILDIRGVRGDVVRRGSANFLTILPLTPLVKSFRTEHRKGFAKVLSDLDKDRFSHLDPCLLFANFLKP